MRGYAIHELLIYDVILRVVPCPNRCYFLFRHSEIVCLFAYIRDVFIVVEDTPRGVLGGVFEVPSSEVPAEVAIKFHCAVPRLFVRLGGSAGRAPFVRFIVVRVTPNVEFAYQNRHAVIAPFGIPSSLHAQIPLFLLKTILTFNFFKINTSARNPRFLLPLDNSAI